MRKSSCLLVLLGLLLAGLVLVGGCAKEPTTPTPPPAPTGKEYVIGAMFAVTGDASSLGIPEKNTAEMLQKMINDSGGIGGRPVKIVIEDTKSDPAEAAKAAKRLVEANNVLAIVGPTRTGETMAVVDYMERVQVPLISCAAGIEIVEPVRKWVFKTPQSDRMAVQTIIEYLKSKSITRIACLSDSTAFGKGGLREIQSLMPPAGIQVVAAEEYGPTDKSMETQLTKIRGTKAQAVVCWGTPPGPAIVAKNMGTLAMTIPLVCSHGVANETFLKIAGEAANGVVLPAGRLIVVDQIATSDPQTPVLEDYAERYTAQAGKSPDTFGGHAWDAIQLVAQALPKSGDDRAKLRDAIEATTNFIGTGGVFNFTAQDHNGLTKDAFVMVEVVDGKWRLLQ